MRYALMKDGRKVRLYDGKYSVIDGKLYLLGRPDGLLPCGEVDSEIGETYVRTEDGIYKVDGNQADAGCRSDYNVGGLCDCYIVDERGSKTRTFLSDYTAMEYVGDEWDRMDIYGAIWVRDEDGLPWLKPVAKLDHEAQDWILMHTPNGAMCGKGKE